MENCEPDLADTPCSIGIGIGIGRSSEAVLLAVRCIAVACETKLVVVARIYRCDAV
jgi:hypothetical protein